MTAKFPDRMEATREAMQNPHVGDEFTEMYSFYFVVIVRDEDGVMIMEAPPERPCELPRDGIVKRMSLEKFRETFAYNGNPENGYWVQLCGRGSDVEGWNGAPNFARVAADPGREAA